MADSDGVNKQLAERRVPLRSALATGNGFSLTYPNDRRLSPNSVRYTVRCTSEARCPRLCVTAKKTPCKWVRWERAELSCGYPQRILCDSRQSNRLGIPDTD